MHIVHHDTKQSDSSDNTAKNMYVELIPDDQHCKVEIHCRHLRCVRKRKIRSSCLSVKVPYMYGGQH